MVCDVPHADTGVGHCRHEGSRGCGAAMLQEIGVDDAVAAEGTAVAVTVHSAFGKRQATGWLPGRWSAVG
jgi:hypothetical protein